MAINPRNSKILTIICLTFCFVSGLVFSVYYEIDEADCFTSNRVYENPDLPTLGGIEKNLLHLFFGNSLYSPLTSPGILLHYLRPLIPADPWLLLFKTLANRFITLEENIRVLKEVVILFKNQGDRSGLLLGIGLLIEAEFVWVRHRPELIREAEEVLNFPDNELFLYERAFLWRQSPGLIQSGETPAGGIGPARMPIFWLTQLPIPL
jgi:hypothetical protein